MTQPFNPPKFTKYTVDLMIKVERGQVGVHFSKSQEPNYPKADKTGITITPIKRDFYKIWSRDDDNSRLRGPETVHPALEAYGPGEFILDFSDWVNDPKVEVKLVVGKETYFEASGSSENIRNWKFDQAKTKVSFRDDREIRFHLP